MKTILLLLSVIIFAAAARADDQVISTFSWKELADAGKFKVYVDGVYPMEKAAEAWEKSRAGHTRGKLIIQVSEGATMKHQ